MLVFIYRVILLEYVMNMILINQILAGPSSKFELTPQLLENQILKQIQLGKKVKGFIFCNPNNPLGVVYSKELAISLSSGVWLELAPLIP